MSILDIRDKTSRLKNLKIILVYLILSTVAILVNHVYALFGHGVSSASMTWMFLFPLLGGTLFYLLMSLLTPGVIGSTGYRMTCNIYNSGIAILTVGSFLKGILEIAGTNSQYVRLYFITGWVFITVGLILLVSIVLRLWSHHK